MIPHHSTRALAIACGSLLTLAGAVGWTLWLAFPEIVRSFLIWSLYR